MGTFEPLQRKNGTNSTRATSTSHHLRPSRSLAPAPAPTSEYVSADQQTQPRQDSRLRYSLADIPLLPPERKNNTGLPDNVKAGIEHLSGMSIDDVHVHYNSSQPAQVEARAHTQGTQIHVGPGQEKHLPHEAWHVVQQKQGRVRPTVQARGMAINDDQDLEREADDIGKKIASFSESQDPGSNDVMSDRTVSASVGNVIQRVRNGNKKRKVARKKPELAEFEEEPEKPAEKKRTRKEKYDEEKGTKKIKSELAEEELAEEEPAEFEEEPVKPKGKKTKGKKRTRKGGRLPEKVEEESEIDADIQAVIDNQQNATLAEIAEALHKAGMGNLSTSTTGVGELPDKTVVVATQLSPNDPKLLLVADMFGIQKEHIHKTLGAGYHVETTLYITYPTLENVGASQGFCPDCQLFLQAKGIAKDGPDRQTPDSAWHSPEYHAGQEKQPVTAAYPYTRQKDARVSNTIIRYATQAEYTIVQDAQKDAKKKDKSISAVDLVKAYRTHKPTPTNSQELLDAYREASQATQKAFFRGR